MLTRSQHKKDLVLVQADIDMSREGQQGQQGQKDGGQILPCPKFGDRRSMLSRKQRTAFVHAQGRKGPGYLPKSYMIHKGYYIFKLSHIKPA